MLNSNNSVIDFGAAKSKTYIRAEDVGNFNRKTFLFNKIIDRTFH